MNTNEVKFIQSMLELTKSYEFLSLSGEEIFFETSLNLMMKQSGFDLSFEEVNNIVEAEAICFAENYKRMYSRTESRMFKIKKGANPIDLISVHGYRYLLKEAEEVGRMKGGFLDDEILIIKLSFKETGSTCLYITTPVKKDALVVYRSNNEIKVSGSSDSVTRKRLVKIFQYLLRGENEYILENFTEEFDNILGFLIPEENGKYLINEFNSILSMEKSQDISEVEEERNKLLDYFKKHATSKEGHYESADFFIDVKKEDDDILIVGTTTVMKLPNVIYKIKSYGNDELYVGEVGSNFDIVDVEHEIVGNSPTERLAALKAISSINSNYRNNWGGIMSLVMDIDYPIEVFNKLPKVCPKLEDKKKMKFLNLLLDRVVDTDEEKLEFLISRLRPNTEVDYLINDFFMKHKIIKSVQSNDSYNKKVVDELNRVGLIHDDDMELYYDPQTGKETAALDMLMSVLSTGNRGLYRKEDKVDKNLEKIYENKELSREVFSKCRPLATRLNELQRSILKATIAKDKKVYVEQELNHLSENLKSLFVIANLENYPWVIEEQCKFIDKHYKINDKLVLF